MKPKTIEIIFAFERSPGWSATVAPVAAPDEYMRGTKAKPGATHKTFAAFVAAFIGEVQDMAIEAASCHGLILAPVNYVEKFWTPDHVKRLANALNRPRSRPSLSLVKFYLLGAWKSKRLDRMTRNELAAHINSMFSMELKPAAVWQLAYRNEHFTKRGPGPKGLGTF